jgi:very-short-patch-repair endonuclease
MREVFDACARLAARQHGAVSWRQLRASGLSESAIGRLVERRWLVRVHAGVYVAGAAPLAWPGRMMAAVLATGGVVSHRTAAAVWDLIAWPSGRIEVTTRRESRSTNAIHVHRGRLEAHEIVTRDGLPVTTPMRAILDTAATTRDEHRLERIVHRATELHLLDASLVPPGRRGSARVRAAMATLPRDEPRITKSHLEERFLKFLHDHDLPLPLTNHPVNGHIVDAYWPHARLIVELDSHAWHDNPIAFEADRAKDQDHVLAGDRVIRLTSRQLTPQTARKIKQLLS